MQNEAITIIRMYAGDAVNVPLEARDLSGEKMKETLYRKMRTFLMRKFYLSVPILVYTKHSSPQVYL